MEQTATNNDCGAQIVPLVGCVSLLAVLRQDAELMEMLDTANQVGTEGLGDANEQLSNEVCRQAGGFQIGSSWRPRVCLSTNPQRMVWRLPTQEETATAVVRSRVLHRTCSGCGLPYREDDSRVRIPGGLRKRNDCCRVGNRAKQRLNIRFHALLPALLARRIGPSCQVSFLDFYSLMTKGKSAATTAATPTITPGRRTSSTANGLDAAID